MKEIIPIACDHAGYELKLKVIAHLKERGFDVKDCGTNSTESCDYPDFAHRLAEAVESGEVELGIALCGTGNGMAITLNKHQGIRAGLAWCSEVGRLVKAHNNANVLVLPARFIPYRIASNIVRTWLDTAFEGGRHQRRIDKMPCR
jgi:ribose 5-phosphate isomerase B